mmetsp:Transcript_39258/g.78441  ORF Transcript_39258/g.78441 Transcript_39258/m.78441 type:complete len:94 (+) Transcript_39258:311-592(+)
MWPTLSIVLVRQCMNMHMLSMVRVRQCMNMYMLSMVHIYAYTREAVHSDAEASPTCTCTCTCTCLSSEARAICKATQHGSRPYMPPRHRSPYA